MATIEIKSIWDALLWSGEAIGLRDAVEQAVRSGASLDRARLDGARLVGARLDGARLDGASLDGASLDGASLDGASLDGASLVGASLDGARLDGARLVPIRSDFFEVLAAAPAEVPGLLAALREGRVDGSQYEGECACLVGTIANLRHEPHNALSIALRPDSTRAAEVWFLAIRKGDTPTNNPVAAITVGWAETWLREQGQPVPVHASLFFTGDHAQLAKDLRAAGVDTKELLTELAPF